MVLSVRPCQQSVVNGYSVQILVKGGQCQIRSDNSVIVPAESGYCIRLHNSHAASCQVTIDFGNNTVKTFVLQGKETLLLSGDPDLFDTEDCLTPPFSKGMNWSGMVHVSFIPILYTAQKPVLELSRMTVISQRLVSSLDSASIWS